MLDPDLKDGLLGEVPNLDVTPDDAAYVDSSELGSEVDDVVKVDVSTLISCARGPMVGDSELMSSPPAIILPMTPIVLPGGPGETEVLAPLLDGDIDSESSEGEGGAASTNNAFSRIDLPSLYF